MEGFVSIQTTDTPAGKRRRRKREIGPEIDRRAERPFNGDTATRLVADPYSTTGCKIAVTASLRDDPLGKLYARRQIDEAQYRVGLMLTEFFELAEIGSVQAVDSSKEPVDGRGAFVETITERIPATRARARNTRPSRLRAVPRCVRRRQTDGRNRRARGAGD
jgi:hypothetical protein